MDQRLLGLYISRILSGFYIFLYNNKQYKLIYPDISIKYEAELYAYEEYEKNKFNDWITEDSIVDTLVTMGVWQYGGDDNLKNLEKQIEDLKVDLYKNFLNPSKIKSIRRTLLNTKGAYNKLFDTRHSLYQYTTNGYAQLLKNNYILVYSLYDNNNHRIFDSIETADSTLLNSLSNIIASNTIDISIFRTIARSDIWKNYWCANQQSMFDKSTINWTDEQKTLVVLTKMYDSAHEHPECPPDCVFEDDDLFDGWMVVQKRENERIRNKNRTEKMLEGKNLNKAGEVFIKANSQEEAQNIYGLNDSTSRNIIKERNTAIFSSDTLLKESDLPDVKRNLVVQSNEQFKNLRKK
jgi:hypothetical protein